MTDDDDKRTEMCVKHGCFPWFVGGRTVCYRCGAPMPEPEEPPKEPAK